MHGRADGAQDILHSLLERLQFMFTSGNADFSGACPLISGLWIKFFVCALLKKSLEKESFPILINEMHEMITNKRTHAHHTREKLCVHRPLTVANILSLSSLCVCWCCWFCLIKFNSFSMLPLWCRIYHRRSARYQLFVNVCCTLLCRRTWPELDLMSSGEHRVDVTAQYTCSHIRA